MDNYSSAIKENDIKKDVNFIMHRNSHYGESAWKLLGFSEIKDNCKRDFSDMNGCYTVSYTHLTLPTKRIV